jgi:hypothetical protein
MSLSQKIAAALDARLDAGGLAGDIAVEDGPNQLSIHLTSTSAVGVAFETLHFAHNGGGEWSTEALKAWGDRLVPRLTYLMEPLVVLEVDPVGGEVELRSQVPTSRNGLRSYYEVRLDRRGALRIARIAYEEATRERRTVACQMTREAVERLADDLVASVG